jgi:hypothetical protein
MGLTCRPSPKRRPFLIDLWARGVVQRKYCDHRNSKRCNYTEDWTKKSGNDPSISYMYPEAENTVDVGRFGTDA